MAKQRLCKRVGHLSQPLALVVREGLGEIVRDIQELAVFNDEAHRIHDDRMAWFKSIQDIHHRMLHKDRRLALQVDVTATPRHDNAIAELKQ